MFVATELFRIVCEAGFHQNLVRERTNLPIIHWQEGASSELPRLDFDVTSCFKEKKAAGIFGVPQFLGLSRPLQRTPFRLDQLQGIAPLGEVVSVRLSTAILIWRPFERTDAMSLLEKSSLFMFGSQKPFCNRVMNQQRQPPYTGLRMVPTNGDVHCRSPSMTVEIAVKAAVEIISLEKSITKSLR